MHGDINFGKRANDLREDIAGLVKASAENVSVYLFDLKNVVAAIECGYQL